MEKNKSIKTNMVMSIILTSSNFIFPLITYTYIARALLPEGTGKVAFVQSAITYFSYIAMLGVAGYGRRECAKVRDNRNQLSKLVQELLFINGVATIVSCIILFLLVFFIPRFSENKNLFLVMSITIPLQAIGMEWLYQALEKYSYITIRSLAFKIISIGLILLLIHDTDDCIIYGAILTFSSSASFVLNFFNARKYITFRKSDEEDYNIKMHLSPIMVFFFSTIIITVYGNLDTLMLGFMEGDYEVGIYNAALKIKSVVVSVSTAITGVMIPRMTVYYNSQLHDKFYNLLIKSFRVTLVLMFPLTCFISENSKDVLMLIGGEKYLPANFALLVLMLCSIVLSLTNFFGNQILIPEGKEKRYSFSVFIGLLIDACLNVCLIPRFGAIGAAVATLITEIWNMTWMGFGCKVEIKNSILQIKLYKYLIPLILACGFDYIFGKLIINQYYFIRLVMNSMAFFGVYYVILLFEKEPIICEGISIMKRFLRKNDL